MDYIDEIILEQYFPYKNMTKDERNLSLNILLHTKDISDSEIYIKDYASSVYDLLFMNLSKENDNTIRFDGAVSSEYENRMVYGVILKRGNKYFVKTNVYRCNDYLYGEDKEYSVVDEFVFKNGIVFRKSRYNEGSQYYEAQIELLNDLEMDEYLENKTMKLKM